MNIALRAMPRDPTEMRPPMNLRSTPVRRRERLGGLLKFYYREAA